MIMLVLTEELVPAMHRDGLSSCLCGFCQSWLSPDTQGCHDSTFCALGRKLGQPGLSIPESAWAQSWGRCSQLEEQQVHPNTANLGEEFPYGTISVHWLLMCYLHAY